MSIPLRHAKARTFHGTKRRIYHLLEEMGTSNDQVWPFASQPFMRSPGPLTPHRTEEWHLGLHAVLDEVVPEERLVWRIKNDGVDGTHAFILTSAGKETTLEHRFDGELSDLEGRLLWRRVEDAHDRAIDALFDKIERVLKR